MHNFMEGTHTPETLSLLSEEEPDIFQELDREPYEEKIFTLDGKEITDEFTE